MKLYDAPFAPNPRRVRWVMAEKGIEDIEVIAFDLMKGEHKTPEYLAKAGLANVPMLELDDGTCITESVAICRYLESRYPEPNLFGRTPQETAVIEMWLRRSEMLVATPIMYAVRHTHPALATLQATQEPQVGVYNREAALRALQMLDGRLQGRDWIAADRITIADIVTFVGIDFGRMIKLKPPEELANLGRWAEAMRSRPAAAAGMTRPAA
jgi:glutathione S-transferase